MRLPTWWHGGRHFDLNQEPLRAGAATTCASFVGAFFLAGARGLEVGITAVIIRPARLLLSGKQATNHITAMRDSVPMSFSSGMQESIVITSLCMYRTIFEACFRLLQQQHNKFWAER